MRIKTVFKYLRPRYLFTAKKGHCTICDRSTCFVLIDRPEWVRNHALCIRCGSSSRSRHVAQIILAEFGALGIERLADFQNHSDLVVYNTSSGGHLAKWLGKANHIICSEYYDDVKPGDFKDGILCQDLQNLTFSDCSIDLIISEDVFEHIPDIKRGFRETHRVLRKGGKHIFSIPFYFDKPTRELFVITNGEHLLTEPIEYHGDPVRGQIPCFTHIGYDIIPFLEEIGFKVKIVISQYADQTRFGTFDCFTFVTEKR